MQDRSRGRYPTVHRHVGGFTLTELMIVVAIVGVLAAIAYPNYQTYVRESRRTDAHTALTTMAANQERHYSDNNTYTTNITAAAPTGLGYASATSPDGYYNLSAAACSGSTVAQCVTMTATATGAQASDTACATITLDTTGAQGPSTTCWNK